MFAYCNISLEATSLRVAGPPPFADERELQVAFAPRIAGRIMGSDSVEKGGYLNILSVEAWRPQSVIAHLETDGPVADGDENLRLLMLAGRRMSGLSDVHSGLMPGWLARSRSWWCDESQTPISLLSLGLCDATGVILGEQCAFLEMFEATRLPAQIVFWPDHPLAPASQVLLDQLNRTPAQMALIAADLRRFMADCKIAPTASDWMACGVMMQALDRSPLIDRYDIFTASGTVRTGPADAVLLALSAEPKTILRHKTLGYHIHMMRHHQEVVGPAFQTWLATAFEIVKRTTDDIKTDYERLLNAIKTTTGATPLIINRMSTLGFEDISNYAPFDAPMSDTLSSIAAKELNLMLHDLADRHDLAIVDVDAIAAHLGGARNVPDGIHQSGRMQAALREEIIHHLQAVAAEKGQTTSNATTKSVAAATDRISSSA